MKPNSIWTLPAVGVVTLSNLKTYDKMCRTLLILVEDHDASIT